MEFLVVRPPIETVTIEVDGSHTALVMDEETEGIIAEGLALAAERLEWCLNDDNRDIWRTDGERETMAAAAARYRVWSGAVGRGPAGAR